MRRLFPFLISLLAATVLSAHGYGRHGNGNMSISIDDDEVRSCDDLRITFNGDRGRFTTEDIAVGNPRTLKVRTSRNGGVIVIGGASGWSVQACRAAALASDLNDIKVAYNGNELTSDGPDEGTWTVYFIVHAPRAASLDLEAHNGPISVIDVDGTVNARAHNGPLSIKGSSGTIDASTQNGPISFEGTGSGNVKLVAQNGPLSVRLKGSSWNGSLDASTKNGPLSVRVPRSFRSGVVVESNGHGPVSCRADGCNDRRNQETDDDDDDDNDWNRPRRFEFGSGPANVHLSTVNGPLSVKNAE